MYDLFEAFFENCVQVSLQLTMVWMQGVSLG